VPLAGPRGLSRARSALRCRQAPKTMTRERKWPRVRSETAPRTSRIGNRWFPKAVGLWRVQGGALALLSSIGHQLWCYILSNNPRTDGDDGDQYCRHSGLVQCATVQFYVDGPSAPVCVSQGPLAPARLLASPPRPFAPPFSRICAPVFSHLLPRFLAFAPPFSRI